MDQHMNNPVKSSKTGLWVASAIILTALLVGGGVYVLQQSQLDALREGLQTQINNLKQQLNDQKNDKDETKKSSDSNLSTAPTTVTSNDTGSSAQPTEPVSSDVEWKLVSGNPEDTCSGPQYEGSATIRGWYSYEENYVEKEWLFRVVDEDVKKLPLQNITAKYSWFNTKLSVVDASSELEDKLKRATKENPVSITIKGYSAYCEGNPSVSLKGVGALK